MSARWTRSGSSEISSHFTTPQGAEQAAREIATVPGMAFWSMSGPAGSVCRECSLWGSYTPHKRDAEGFLRNRRCVKYTRLKQGEAGPGVPPQTPSCKFFERAESIPELEKRPS